MFVSLFENHNRSFNMQLNPCAKLTLNIWYNKGNIQEVSKQKSLENCVARYAKPQGFCNKLKWLAFLVWNAIKAVFGRSDWQKASHILNTEAVPHFIGKTDLTIKINPIVSKKVGSLSNKILSSLVEIQERGTVSDWKTGKEKSFQELVGKLNDEIDVLFPNVRGGSKPQSPPSEEDEKSEPVTPVAKDDVKKSDQKGKQGVQKSPQPTSQAFQSRLSLESTDVEYSVSQILKKLGLKNDAKQAITEFLLFCQNHAEQVIRKTRTLLVFNTPRTNSTDKDITDKKEFHRLYKAAESVLYNRLLSPVAKSAEKTDKVAEAKLQIRDGVGIILAELGHGVVQAKNGNRKLGDPAAYYREFQTAVKEAQKNLKLSGVVEQVF